MEMGRQKSTLPGRNIPETPKDEKAQEDLGFGRYPNIKEFVRNLRKKLTDVVEASQTIPQGEMNYLICSTYPDFEERSSAATIQLCQMLKQLSTYHGVPSATHRLFGSPSNKSSVLQGIHETSKQFKERMDLTLDELARLKDENASVGDQASARFPVAGVSLKGNQKFQSKPVHMPRPQVVHGWTVDNTDKPFVPKLKVKHNALRSLDYSMKDLKEGGSAPHPYQFELEVFEPERTAMVTKEPLPALPVEQTPFAYVDTAESLQQMLKELASATEIAVDVEHHSYRTYLGITCLVQLSTRARDFVIDAIAVRSHMHELNDVFTNSQILKVFHGADADVLWLQRDFGIYIVNMFDTGQAARALTFPKYSLSYLMYRYLNKIVDKTHQLSDWRQRPLPDDMLVYARSDTHDLLYLYDCVRNELLAKDSSMRLLQDVYTKSKDICLKRYEKTKLDENDFALVMWKFAKNFSEQQKFALKRILEWRDQISRDMDESLGYVLPTKACIDISESLPKSSEDLVRCVEFVTPVLKQRMHHVLHITKEARSFSGIVPVPVNARARKDEEHQEVIERPIRKPLTALEFAQQFLKELPVASDFELVYDRRGTRAVRADPESDLLRQIWEYSLTIQSATDISLSTKPIESSAAHVPASEPKPLPIIEVTAIEPKKKKDKHLRNIDQAAVDVVFEKEVKLVNKDHNDAAAMLTKSSLSVVSQPGQFQPKRVEKRSKSPLIVTPAEADGSAPKRVAFSYQNADYSKFAPTSVGPAGQAHRGGRHGGGVRDPNKSFNKHRNMGSSFSSKSRGGFRKPE